RLPWTASLPRGRVSPARLELLRVLVAHHSPGHPALRACRRHRATPAPSGISVEYRPNQHLREIHRRTSGHQQDADLPPRRMNRNSEQIPDSQEHYIILIYLVGGPRSRLVPKKAERLAVHVAAELQVRVVVVDSSHPKA